jgi:hypothetical protein
MSVEFVKITTLSGWRQSGAPLPTGEPDRPADRYCDGAVHRSYGRRGQGRLPIWWSRLRALEDGAVVAAQPSSSPPGVCYRTFDVEGLDRFERACVRYAAG